MAGRNSGFPEVCIVPDKVFQGMSLVGGNEPVAGGKGDQRFKDLVIFHVL